MRRALIWLTPPGILAVLYPVAWLARQGGLDGGITLRLASLGWSLIALGAGLLLWAAVQFRRHRTTIFPIGTPTALMDRGPFAFSRNPIYLADLVILTGIALVAGGLVYYAVPLVLFTIFQTVFIPPEEAKLRAGFGAAFEVYRARVRRWI